MVAVYCHFIESKWIKSGTNILKESLWDLTTMVWKIIITTQLICTRSLEDLSTERIFLRSYVNFSKACQCMRCFPLRDSSIARMAIVKMRRFALSFPLADLAASGGKVLKRVFLVWRDFDLSGIRLGIKYDTPLSNFLWGVSPQFRMLDHHMK